MSTVTENRKKDDKKVQLFKDFSKQSTDVFMGDGCGSRDNCGPLGGCTCDIPFDDPYYCEIAEPLEP